MTEAPGSADARTRHYAALVALEDFGPAGRADLSARTGIHRSDLVVVISELAAREPVERTPDPGDRRRNVITLAPPGRLQLRKLGQILDAAQAELLAPCPPGNGSSSPACWAGSSSITRTGTPSWDLTAGKTGAIHPFATPDAKVISYLR
ncbi:MarR family winged helix-turn-helix transcriptional regulator [Streptomyces avidinii]|uniref:DNA-binding MarR family transcriptional regulator n=1 Tax=Streptomyces avidinii TaxID=1895 RepID=A0ABS4LHW2_STRAV|nr:MarR family winged helix-turn-helix transcriptional regulator [Streptomyces avidinii]MBP2041626.1 DNA-binding MarR family transcriptional regulator [Streptomyces avidinii]